MGKSNPLVYDAHYWACRVCDHTWYVSDAINADVLTQYYRRKNNLLNPMQEGDRQHKSLTVLAKLASAHMNAPLLSAATGGRKLRVLEIGGGDGAFADVFTSMNRSSIGEYLIYDFGSFTDSEQSSFRRIPDKAAYRGKADIVVSRHTLEHVLDLDSFVAEIGELLVDDGMCYIEVPCWTLPHFSVDELNAEHLQHFTHKSADILFTRISPLAPSGDFSVFLKDYYTPHRLLGKFFAKSAGARRFEHAALGQGQSFKARKEQGREQLRLLAQRIKVENGGGNVVGLHGATITLEDFLINEGAGIAGAGSVMLFDGAAEKHGSKVGGMLVHRPDHESARKLGRIVCFSSFLPEITATWRTLGFKGEVVSYLS